MTTERKCTRCGKTYPATTEYFYALAKRKDGSIRLMSECIYCRREYQKGHSKTPKYAEWNRERKRTPEYKAWNRDYQREYARTPERKAKMLTYRLSHKDAISRKNRSYYHRPEIKAKSSERHRTPAYRQWESAYYHRRKALRASLPASFTDRHWALALEYWDNRCCVCGKAPDGNTVLAKDHWIPETKSGGFVPENIVPLCHSVKGGIGGCNNVKNNRDPLEWLVAKLGEERAAEKLVAIAAYFAWITAQS